METPLSVTFSQNAVVANPGQQYALSSLLTLAAGDQPEYLVLVGLDRERYIGASNGNRGTLEGNGHSAAFAAYPGSDSYSIGMVFTHTDTGYYNSTYGYLDKMSFTSSTDQFRSEYLTLYGFGKAGTADEPLHARLAAEIGGPFFNGTAFMAVKNYPDASHLGTLDMVTRAGYTDLTPNTATPNEIAAAAASYVGQAWNDNGCWVLASNIAASAGASLPLTSNSAHPDQIPPTANGGWIVAYNSAAASDTQQASWQAQLRPGDIVVSNNACGGHIATVVSGFGYSALFIDNSGPAAIGGAPHDIVIEAAHYTVPWGVGPDLDNIVVYRLDTPVVTVNAPLCVEANASAAVAPLFSTLDPAGKAVTSYQFYDTGSGSFTVDGAVRSAHSAAGALTVDAASVGGMSFKAGAAAGSDTILVRAFNGSLWGDWQSIDVAVGSRVQPAQVHAVSDTLFIHGGKSVTLASLFAASAGDSAITSYTVTQSAFGGSIALNGAADMLGGSRDPSMERSYQVSAADFAKLTFTASSYISGEMLSVTAHNGSALASLTARVSVSTLAPTVHGISHWIGIGADVPLSSLFSVTLPDETPVVSYSITTNVRVIDWRDNTPSQGGTIELNGAVNLLATTGAPAGEYMIAAADLGKVTFHAAPDAGAQILQVWANDGSGGTPGALMLTTVAGASPITAKAVSVHDAESVAASALFAQAAGAAAPLYYRFVDPTGGGSLRLDAEATNLQSKNDTTPGVYIIAAGDLGKLAYVGGSASGSEILTVSASSDMLHWSAEALVQAATLASALTPVVGGAADDRISGTRANEAFDGGPGIDTVVLAGPRSHFNVVRTDAGLLATDLTGAQGKDTLANIERVRFDDGALAFDTEGNAGQLFRLYQAAFDRKPDATGLGWWLNQVDHGESIVQVAGSIMKSAEFTHLYGAQLSDAQFLDQLYQNVLHRAGEASGVAFWRESLGNGVTREGLLAQFADSPENHAQVIGSIQNGIAYIYAG